jgi:hypothetical protein
MDDDCGDDDAPCPFCKAKRGESCKLEQYDDEGRPVEGCPPCAIEFV